MNDDIQVLRERLRQLNQLHDEGAVGDEAWVAAKAAIERELLDAVMAAPAAATPSAATADAAARTTPAGSDARPSRTSVLAVLSFTVVVAIGGYLWTGSPGVPSSGAPGIAAAGGAGAAQAEAPDEQQFIAAVEKLAQRLETQPDDPEGWAMLARSYGMLGRLDDAVPAYAKAVSLRGDDARLLADYADALALKNDRNLEGEPLALVKRSLAIDPNNLKALSLAGAAAFNRQDYAGAVGYWEKVAANAPPDSPYLPQVRSSIAEARSRGGLPGATAQAGGAASAANPAPAATTATGAVAAGPSTITGTVRLSPALARQAAPDDTVFIYARPAEGSRMPLAIVRKRVADLPANFTLDDSMAMSPAAKLSQHTRVIVSARVSKSGQAAPSAGDLVGQSVPVDNGRKDLLVEIDEVVRP